VEGVTSSHEAS